MRKIVLPTFEAKDCLAGCEGTGKLPPQEVRCDNCGDNLIKQAPCQGCAGIGQLPPTKAVDVLLQTLAPTMQESQQGKGIDWEKYVVYHPIAQGLKTAEETGEVFLSNPQWEALGECIKKTQWRRYDEEVFAILQAVMEATDEEAAQVAELNRETRRSLAKADGRR